MNVIENNDNFKETIKNEVEKLDKKESYVYKKPDGTIYYGPEPPPEGEQPIEDLTHISSTVMVSNTAGDVIFVDPTTNICTGRFNESVRCDFDYVNDYPKIEIKNTKILSSTNVKFEDNITNTNGLTITGSNNITLGSADNIIVSDSSDVIIGEDC